MLLQSVSVLTFVPSGLACPDTASTAPSVRHAALDTASWPPHSCSELVQPPAAHPTDLLTQQQAAQAAHVWGVQLQQLLTAPAAAAKEAAAAS